MCVIADDEGVESLAGIMGGEKTGCDESTTDVLIESALWDAGQYRPDRPQALASIPMRAIASSAASIRPSCCRASRLATHMVLDLCGGTPSEITVAGNAEPPEKIIDFPLSELERLAGLDVPLTDMRRVLNHLGFFVAGQSERVKVAVPIMAAGRRGQGRHRRGGGAHRRRRSKCRSTPFPRGDKPRKPVLTPIQVRTRKAKRALAARNLVEAVTWSFIAKPQAELFGGGKPELALANPIAAELSDMRPSLIPGLIAAARRNTDRGFPDVGLFEVGQIFRGDRPEDQFTAAAGIRRALAKPSGIGRHWAKRELDNEVDAFDAKADALSRADRGGRAGAGAAGGARRPGVAASRPFRHHPDRAAERARLFRRIASERAGKARCRRPAGRLSKSILEQIPEPKAKATRAKPALESVAVPAGGARLRLCRRAQREGRRSGARGAWPSTAS